MTIGAGPTRVSGTDRALSPRDRVVLSTLCAGAGESGAGRGGDRRRAVGRGRAQTWTKVVQGLGGRLRKTWARPRSSPRDTGYRLAVPGDLDTVEFERLVARGRENHGRARAGAAARTSGRALSLWRGRRSPSSTAGTRRGRRPCAPHRRTPVGRGGFGPGPPRHGSWPRRPPTRRRSSRASRSASGAGACWRSALDRTGRQREALDVLRRARHVRRGTASIPGEPSLETRMLQQVDPEPSTCASVAASATCPYRGLRALRRRRRRLLPRATTGE